MAPPRLLVRPLATLAAGLLVAGLVQAAPAVADEPAGTPALSVTVTAVDADGETLSGGTEGQPADLGIAPGSATLDILVTNNGAEAVQSLVVTSESSANGTVSTPVCGLPAVDPGGVVLPAGQSVTCSAVLSGVLFTPVHKSVFLATGTVEDPASAVSAVSTPFFATASEPPAPVKAEAALTISAPESATVGTSIAVEGLLTRADEPYAASTVLERELDGSSSWTTVKPVSSAADGVLATTVTADRTAAYRFRFAGDASTTDAVSPSVLVEVSAKPKTPVALTAKAPGSAITGTTITVKGSIKRDRKAFKTKTQLQRQVGDGSWTTVKNVKSTSKGALSAKVKADRTAGYRYRYAGTSTIASGTSNVERVEVRKAHVRLTVAAPGSVVKGKSIKVKGSIKREGKKYRTTTVLEFSSGDGWSRVKTVKSSRKGSLSASVKPSRTGEYRYRYAGNGTTDAATSAADHVTVKPKPPTKPKPRAYKNCTALNQVYPHGVGRSGARDEVRGSTDPVTDFVRDTKTYKLNTKSDRDKDGVACEQQ